MAGQIPDALELRNRSTMLRIRKFPVGLEQTKVILMTYDESIVQLVLIFGGQIMEQKVQVLILDDEPIVGKRLGPALMKMGCEVESFEDPKKALQRIEEKDF